MRMIMAASIDQAGRKVNLDAADGVSGRDPSLSRRLFHDTLTSTGWREATVSRADPAPRSSADDSMGRLGLVSSVPAHSVEAVLHA